MTEERNLTTKSLMTLAILLPWEKQEVGGMKWIHASSRFSVFSAFPFQQWSLSHSYMAPLSKATPGYACFLHKILSLSFYNIKLDEIFQPFEEAIWNICDKVTFCTLDLYNTIIKDLPPTPSKFHYVFNLRDLSRVYNGLTLTTPDRLDLAHSLY